ncbi:MAG TPA: hypothetical protein VLN91_08150, partial [Nitrospirota bacterium]|nr:hypothetical protein [Nitrospirota bacterium]
MNEKNSLRGETASGERRKRPRRLMLGLLTACVLVGSGCASELTTVLPRLPEKYETLGHGSGRACGSLLIGPTAYNFIPVMLNSRVERAYQTALESVPGSTALMNVTLEEDWFWWLIGSARCTT